MKRKKGSRKFEEFETLQEYLMNKIEISNKKLLELIE